ncbi:UNVERIFIED_ORG: hypothetical protein J3A77_000110 [Bacillus sp. PvP124]|nr:hypothetical protein [Bacillus sp. PvP124]
MDITIWTFWLSIPSSFRLAILIFLFLLLFRVFLIYISEKTGVFFLGILKQFMIVLFFIIEKILIIGYKIIGSSLNSINHWFEEFKSKTMQGIKPLRSRWAQLWHNKEAVTKKYKQMTYILPVLMGFIVYQWPELKGSELWFEEEEKGLREHLNVHIIPPEVARAELVAWIGGLGSNKVDSSETQMVLREDKGGGNIRQTPSKEGNIVTSISPNEIVSYLQEESIDDRGVTWYKVQTKYGEIGWISSTIIEQY